MLKTGWIDPYSPVSNSNTEEMEELLRVEEEILNSPPKAEPASKADKGDKVRLSGAARKRLAHYLAKGVPLEQARVLAKQQMPTAERGKKAGSSLKRERSANTTPEMSLPKRGSAKPGAGECKIEAGSTNQKAAQPPIRFRNRLRRLEPGSTARTAKWPVQIDSHVIAKGYPTALLSTKELVVVREAILDKIREQRQGAVKPYFTGCSLRPGWLLISCANQETANWLKATVPKLKLWNGAQIEIVAEADMPRPQIYVGYFPKTEKCSNEDILQLLEGKNSALRIGDWRTLNRVERKKHVELTLSVDPVSDDLLKSQGYTLCYGFGLVNVRPKNRHSVGVKDTAAEPEPGTASTTQVQEDSQELPCCSNSIAPSSNTPEEEKKKAGGSTLEGLLASAKAAKMERPATNTPLVARMRPPLYGRLPNKPGKGARRSQEETVLLGSNRALAWWTKVKQRKATAELSKLQRLVCVGITGAMRTSPTDALGIITGISPLPVLIEKEACLGALRLQGVANLKSGDLTGHLKILKIFFSSPIVHLSDVQLPRMEPKSGTQMAPNLKMETQELGYGGHASVGQ
ncbi:hypothetical protein ACLKA6_002312 [Drosophila palustris]